MTAFVKILRTYQMNGPLAETKGRAANSTEVTLETLKSFG